MDIETPAEPTPRATAFDLVASQPWAIQPDMLATIAAIARRENDAVEAVEARLGRPLQNARKVSMRGAVAVIPVTGPVFRYANLFTEVSGATSLEVLAKEFTVAAEDPAVKHIVLNLDSPGGQAQGIAEFAHMVRSADKPVTAYVDGTAASAAYWIAAAADRIVMSKTAMVGSIGAVVSINPEKRDGAVEIVSSQSPKKRPDVTTEAGRGQVQSLIDALAQVFIEDVAQYRGVSADDVIARFGGGDVFLASEAVARGMADEVGTFEGLIAGLSGATASKGVPFMAEKQGAPAAQQPEITREYLATNHADIVCAIQAEAATAERTRVLGVQGAAIPGHDKLVAQLIDEGVSIEAASLRILQAEKASMQGRADAMRADAPAPVAHATAPADEDAGADDDLPVEERAKADWDKSKSLRAEFGTLGAYTAYLKATANGRARVLGK